MMKKAILSFGLCFLLVLVLSAQESGQITVEKKGMKKIYSHDGESIDAKQLSSLLQSNPSSAGNFKASKTYSIVGASSLAVGTVFIGVGFYYTIKSAGAVGDNDLAGTTDYSNKSTSNMLLGAGFYALSIPFMILSNSNLKKSINLYNASSGSADLNDVDLYFGFTNDGLGVGLRF
jgi:hypothetical protein